MVVGMIRKIFWPTSWPTSTQVVPPSVDLRTPDSGPPSLPPLLFRRCPAKTTVCDSGVAAVRAAPVLSSGLMATVPIDNDGSWSVDWTQLGTAAVALLVCQMPPLTVAIKSRLALKGSAAMPLAAPPKVAGTADPALEIGPGPCSTQSGAPIRETAGTARSSRVSTTNRNLDFLGRRGLEPVNGFFKERPES
jgi:hypothetical protein